MPTPRDPSISGLPAPDGYRAPPRPLDLTEAIRRSMAGLSAIVASTDDAIIGKSPEGKITSWNTGAELLYGYTAAEAVGQHISLCVPPDRLAETEDAINRVLRGERLAHYDTVRQRKGGEPVDVSVTVSPVLDDAGRVVGASSISRDITERKRTERRQKAEHSVAHLAAEARSFEEAAPRLVAVLAESLAVDVAELFVPDAGGRLIAVGTPVSNTVTSEGAVAGFDALASLGLNTPGIPPDGGWAEQARQERRMLWFTDIPAEGSDSVPAHAIRLGYRSGCAFPVFGESGCLAVVTLSSRKPFLPDPQLLATVASIGQTIGQLIRRTRAETDLRTALVRRDRFLAMLSHELRNPLAAARAALSALRSDHLDRPGRTLAYDVIARQVQHMSHLLDDLLDVARVTQDRLKLRMERFDLERAIGAALELVEPIARERHVPVSVLRVSEPLPVLADAGRVTQMLSNLLTNAVKYSPAGRVVRLFAERAGDQVVLRVHDDGIGMAREVLDRAFDLFYQADETLDRRQSGMGVGLTLARSIAMLHGGTLTATSDGPGQGSEFVVRLPLSLSPRVEVLPAVVATSLRRYRIALVEDHEDNREMIRLLLSCEGHHVDVAANGAEGLTMIERTRPDVALLDIGLPGIDGFMVAERIRQNRDLDSVGLIALSGYAQETDIERGRAAGFDAHVAKPMTPEHLLQVVETVVAHRNGKTG
jgi:PAS domain S-box-containing protein